MPTRRAFTLVELLIVIAIISVLAALLLPTLENAVEQSRRAVCANNQHQLYLTAGFYAADFNDRLPKNGGPASLQFNWLSSTKAWIELYVGIPLYTAARAAGGAPINGAYGTGGTGYFASIADRGILACPGNREASIRSATYSCATLTYGMYGFGGFPSPGWFYAMHDYYPTYPRFSKAGLSLKGYPKTFISDALYETMPPAWYTASMEWFPIYNTNHSPGKPQGTNVTAGDGSLKWVLKENTIRFSEENSLPLGYYTQSASNSPNPADPTAATHKKWLYVMGPTGSGYTNAASAEFWQYWY